MDSGHKNRTGWPPHVSFGDFAFGYNPLRLLAFGHHSRLFIGRVAPESSLSWMDSLLTATRMERCLFLRADVIPGPAYRRSRPCRPLSPTAISPCAPQYKAGARCSIRPGRGAYRADLAPVGFNTAPSQRAGYRRLNRYAQPRHGTCFEKPGSTPRLRFAAFGLSKDTLWTRALQRAVRLAAYCSFTGQ